MRGWIALAAMALGIGCTATRVPRNTETHAQLSGSGFVTLPRLADDLQLQYRGEESGLIELSAPPNHVMFVEDSRRVLINATHVSMIDPCMRRGNDYILTADDAELVRRRYQELRTAQLPPAAPPRPLPLAITPVPASGLPLAWRPAPGVSVRAWQYIVIHHEASATGSAAYIHKLHQARGWDGLGYDFVIGNGSLSADGEVEAGYRWTQQLTGAHARANENDDNRWNLHGIGICLVGDFTKTRPTKRQMDALVKLVRALREEYDIPVSRIVPHRYVRSTECPGDLFPWDDFIARVR